MLTEPDAATVVVAVTMNNSGTEDYNKGESWVDDEFISFGGGDDDDDNDEDVDEDANHNDRGNHLAPQQQQRGVDSLPPPPPPPLHAVVLPPWMDVPTDYRRVNPLIALHNEIVSFCHLMQPLPEEMKERQELIQRIQQLVYKTFGGPDKCKVEVFGSQATGMCLPTSDIDLVIILKDEDDKEQKQPQDGMKQAATTTIGDALEDDDKDEHAKEELQQQQRQLQRLEDELEMAKYMAPSEQQHRQSPLQRLAEAVEEEFGEQDDELSYLEVIEQTTVPLVKLTHGPTNISVDICFNREEGVRAATLIKTFLQAMPPLRPLTFVLKYFLAARAINEPYSGGVGSYMLQLMIVSFLQARERYTTEQHRGHPNLYNLGALLVEFLELYGLDFNYITTGISVRYDGSYFPKGDKNRKEHFWQALRPFSLAMENPLEVTLDIGRPSFRISTVQRAFEVAFKILLTHVATPVVPTESILASILPPTEEMSQRAAAATAAALKQPSSNKRFSRNESSSSSYRETSASSRVASSSRSKHDVTTTHDSDMDTDSADEASDRRRKRHRRR